jgi:uncharacterized protein
VTLDEIIAALKSTNAAHAAALLAGVAHADELAPVVYSIVAKFCRGIHLLPADTKLLFNGLHVLAAARHPGLCERVIAIAHQSGEQLDHLFSDHTAVSLARLLLSVWDRGANALFDLIEHADLAPEAEWALYDVLARQTYDGRIPRDQTTSFLARIERDSLIEDGEAAWWGWEQAVVKLGLVELEPALRRAWSKAIYLMHSKADHDAMLEALQRVAANPSDSSLFDAEHVQAIEDPVEAVAWSEQRVETIVKWAAEQRAEHGCDDDAGDDAAEAVRLTADERNWLAGFLASPQVPDSTMSLEMLDGFFTALIIGPKLVVPSEYFPVIWGADNGTGPNWDSPEQAQHVVNLLTKHWNAIAARRLASAEHCPMIDNFGIELPGEEWADGFFAGIEMRKNAWGPMFDDRRADQIVMPILALCSHAPKQVQGQVTAEMREGILQQLPATVQMIAAYWRAPNLGSPRREPRRSTKVGRNEPCPCGSGKKFKKCCGSGAPPLVQ